MKVTRKKPKPSLYNKTLCIAIGTYSSSFPPFFPSSSTTYIFPFVFVSNNNLILRITDADSKNTPRKSKKMRTEQKEQSFQLFSRKKAKECYDNFQPLRNYVLLYFICLY